MRSYCFGVHDRNKHICVRDLGSEAAVASDDTTDLRPYFLCVLQGTNQIGADVALQISAANRKDEHQVTGVQVAAAQPVGKRSLPPIVIHSRCKFRDVISGRVGLNSCDFSEIIHGVRCVASTAAHA